jgi:murein DD-endopeptidase MepM/ murein hydrolase activator NlpD
MSSRLTLAVLLFVATAAAAPKQANWIVKIQPTRLVNGSPILFQVTPPTELKSLSGTWMGHDVYFASVEGRESWYGLAGAAVETKPGTYTLDLHGMTEKDKPLTFAKKVSITKAKYPHVKVTVAAKFTQPNPDELKEIDADKKIKQDTFAHVNPDREWSGNFTAPVDARISDVFGTARTFNGQVQGVHQGLDYAVPAGTPVLAVNRGVVLLAQPLYFEGNCVVLDHGQGLLSIYMHLSKIDVKAGQQIDRGTRVGLSGGTGRATGPHLHVAARWQGVYVDPERLLALQMP